MSRIFKPLFMFGMDRSGTTLLSMIAGAHPRIAVPHATANMWFGFAKRLESTYSGLESPQDIERLVDHVLAHERVQIWRTELDRRAILERIRPGDFGSVVTAVHQAFADSHGKPHWANMDIGTLELMHQVNQWISDARFLHIIRDGRDVALSHQTMPFGAGNIAECAQAWVSRLTLNLRMGDVLGADRYLAFRYEDLVLNPSATLEKICAFAGVSYSSHMLDYGDTVEARVPEDKLWLWPELKGPLQPSKVGRWKREMSESQRIVFEMTAGPLLAELGYETYDPLPRRISAYALELTYFLGRGGRGKRLLRKLGLHRPSKLERNAVKDGGS